MYNLNEVPSLKEALIAYYFNFKRRYFKMKYFSTVFIIFLSCMCNVFSQQLPEFTVSNSFEQGDYFSMIFFYESESQKINEDYLFTSEVSLNSNDTIVTDTLLFRFNKDIIRIRIKKISFSRNEVEYFSADSFPVVDTSKWKLGGKQKDDSILFLDTVLYIKLYTGKGYLKFQLDKKYTIKKNDTFKILLDTLPQREIVGLLPRQTKPVNIFPNKTTMFFSFLGTQSPSERMLGCDLFNLAGKRQYLSHKGSNVYIYYVK